MQLIGTVEPESTADYIVSPYGVSKGSTVSDRISLKWFEADSARFVAIYRDGIGKEPCFLRLRYTLVSVQTEDNVVHNVWINKNSFRKRFSDYVPRAKDIHEGLLNLANYHKEEIFFNSCHARFFRPTLALDDGLYVLKTKASSAGDPVLGRGSFKVAKEADYYEDRSQLLNGHKTEVAVLIARRGEKETDKSWKESQVEIEREIDLMEQFKGVPFFLQILTHYKREDTKRAKNNKYYMVVERCVRDLFDLKKVERNLPVGINLDTKRLSFEIASAVSTLNERNLIHRDLKQGNVLVDREGHAKLSDFGATCRTDDAKARREYKGTFPAPEQADCVWFHNPDDTNNYFTFEDNLEKATTIKSDSWGLGCILFSLLHSTPGSRLIKDGSWQNLIEQTLDLTEPKIEEKLKGIEDPVYRSIVRDLLRIKPEHRITSTEAMQQLAAHQI